MTTILDNITVLLLLLFLAITFIQSGIDKMVDWKGNIDWLKSHFSKTFMANMVPLNLGIVLVIEVIAGVFCLLGIYQIIVNGTSSFAFYGVSLSCVTLLLLLFGQRVAKDYDGARTIVIYFIPAIFTLFLLKQ